MEQCDNIKIWYGGSHQIEYRLPFINLKYSDVDEIKPENKVPIKGMLLMLPGNGEARILITDTEWLKIVGEDMPFKIMCREFRKDGFLGQGEYAWSY
jgi:hypothetical protein